MPQDYTIFSFELAEQQNRWMEQTEKEKWKAIKYGYSAIIYDGLKKMEEERGTLKKTSLTTTYFSPLTITATTRETKQNTATKRIFYKKK